MTSNDNGAINATFSNNLPHQPINISAAEFFSNPLALRKPYIVKRPKKWVVPQNFAIPTLRWRIVDMLKKDHPNKGINYSSGRRWLADWIQDYYLMRQTGQQDTPRITRFITF